MKKLILFILVITLAATEGFAQRRHAPAPSREQVLEEQYSRGLFRGIDGIYFDMENDPHAISANAFFNVLDWLQGRVPGLQVYRSWNLRIPYLRNQPAAIFLDEVRMSPDILNVLPVNDIGMIKVMRSPMVNVWGAGGGVIAIYTKRGELDEEE
jgi:hypothetical protein